MKILSAILFSSLLLWTTGVGAEDIYDAIKNNDLGSIGRFYRSNHINVVPDASKGRPLNYAIKKGNTEAVKLLMGMGADLNAMSHDKTPLMYAAKYHRVDIANLLMAKGVNVNVINSKGQTALMYAAKYGSPDIARILISAGADVQIKDHKKRTAYDRAIKAQNDEVAQVLWQARRKK